MITNKKMLNALKVLNTFKYVKLNIKLSYAIKKNIDILSRELKVYEEERLALVDRYGEKDEKGILKIENGNYIIKDIEEFNKDIYELMNIENEIEFYDIYLEEISKSNLEISAEEIGNIDFLLI